MPNWLRFSVTLLVIGAVAGGGLALVEAQTKAEIEKNTQRKLEGAFRDVPGYRSFKQVGGEMGSRVFELYDEKSGAIGYAAEAACPKSYNGRDPVVVVVVVDAAVKKVLLVRTTNNKETPGLGTRLSEEKPPPPIVGTAPEQPLKYPFLDKFRDRPADKLAYERGTGFDAVTGATVSSNAVLNGVKAAVKNIQEAVGRK
jgi:Na+-translocating ferredoxin:NAD+ oxidoreductase RnfG subunit